MPVPSTTAARRGSRTVGRAVAVAAALGTGVVAAQPVLAAELVTAELVGTQNEIEVQQGSSASFTVSLSATGTVQCGSTSTAKVRNDFAVAASGVTAGSTYSAAVSFAAVSGTGNNCTVSGGGTVPASVSVAAGTPLGVHTVSLSETNGGTLLTNSNTQGGKLGDSTGTTLTFRVVAPPNQAPATGVAPGNASGQEGGTLQTAGSFTDADANLSSVAITSGAGTLTPARDGAGKPTGAWSWELPTTDQTDGSVTVTATDAFGATATQTFTYAAANAAPRVSGAAADASGNEGDTLGTSGSFADVSGDPLTITRTSGAGTVTDNRDGTWSWSLGTGDETSGTVEVTAGDGDGGTVTDTFRYAAANVAPGVRTDAGDVSGDEGSPLGNAGAFGDVPADTLTLSATGAGTLTPGSTNGAWSWSLPAGDDGTGQVAVTASDGVATSAADAFTWTVSNVAPQVVTAATDAVGFEGTTLSTSGSFGDPADALAISQLSGPGTVTDNGDGTWSWTLEGTDDLAGTVVVQASDGDGGVQQDAFDVTVQNLAPAVAGAAADATGSEGNTLTTSGGFSDVAADTLSITTTSTVGSLVTGPDGTWSWSLDTTDQVARGSVTVTATDDDGGSASDTFEYEASDVAPQLARAAEDATGDEGTTLTTSGAFQDAAADRITVSKVRGPGTLTDLGDGEWSWSLPTTDQVTGTVVVQATDKDGVTSDSDEFSVVAANVAPRAGTQPTDQAGAEGAGLATSGSFTDVSGDPVSITQESGAGTLVDNGDGTWSWSLSTTDDGSGTVVVVADDGDGAVTRQQFQHTATNVAPQLSTLTVTGGTGTACITGNAVGLAFSVTDPGTADTLAGTINWGDGSSTPFSTRSVSTTHSYAAGSYTITVDVSDDDGGAAVRRSGSVSRSYAVSAVGAPFNVNGSSIFKYGSVAPVKVRITDCANAPVAGLAPTIRTALTSSLTPGSSINETVASVSSADTAGVMRYDGTSGNYVYNLATKSLRDGDARYTLEVVAAGTATRAGFGLRTK